MTIPPHLIQIPDNNKIRKVREWKDQKRKKIGNGNDIEVKRQNQNQSNEVPG